MDLDLNDRVYIVADWASGLGLATAECLVAKGARVVVAGESEHALEAAVTDLGESAAVSVAAIGADADAPERLVAAALATEGRLDGALVSVGGSPGGRIMDVTDAEWTTAFESVFLGVPRTASSKEREMSKSFGPEAALRRTDLGGRGLLVVQAAAPFP